MGKSDYKKTLKRIKVELEMMKEQMQQQLQLQRQMQMQQQLQEQKQIQNDTDTISNVGNTSNVGNPVQTVNVNVIAGKSVEDDQGEGPSNQEPRLLTTGVLNTTANTQAAHVEFANLSIQQQEIRYQVYQWVDANPVLLIDETLSINPGQHVIRTQSVQPYHYEIRVFHPGDPNVLVTTFAIDNETFTVPGLTFNQDQMMEIDL
jgi:protocatechuate 3,4-dioxygenase beta subunit